MINTGIWESVSCVGTRIETICLTYPDIVCNKTPCVKWTLEEWSNTVKEHKNSAGNSTVRGLKPLSM